MAQSVKNVLVHMLSNIDKLNHSGNDFSFSINPYCLVLVTAAGTIKGNLCKPADNSPLEECIPDAIFCDIEKTINTEIDTSSSPFILLKDATLLDRSGTTIYYRYLYIFTNDIIAATIADAD